MSATAETIHFEERAEPGAVGSALLAALVHVLLFGVLVEPAPPPKPEPVVEPPKPDIAIKAKPEPPKPKPKPEPPKPKPELVKPKHEPAKPAAPARPREDEMQKRMRDELAREQNAVKVDRERQEISAAAQKSALSAYAEKIKAKVKGNWILPIDLKGNPEAVFVVIQLPTGEVLAVKLKKASGNAAYDAAVERAILKSSPLPRPEKGELFQRELILTFRPQE
ncbi:MAG: TonB C-terminal domain-containing protein [Betaproteobacteria bacterium]|nr:TonB C-terminal domain-containing protein [Betaproteobacteria bacterium]